MNPILKKILIWAAVALGVLLMINAWLYKVALTKAELVNIELKKRAAILETEKADIMAIGEAFARAKAKEIQAIQAAADEKMAQAAAIKSKTAGQIFAIRSEKITIEAKYSKLEDDALAKVEKIKLLEGANISLVLEIKEWGKLEDSRVATIAKLNGLIDDPKKGYKALLAASVANTESILKANRSFWKRISVVAGYGVNARGDWAFQLTAGIKVL